MPHCRPVESPRYSGPIACLVAALLAVCSSLCGAVEPKAPSDVQIVRLATGTCKSRIPTHVRITGAVASVRKEADGDYHVRLCAEPKGAPCVVVEIIPSLSADRIVTPKTRAARTKAVVRKGDRLEVVGISRWDVHHSWWEIHPATSIKVLGRVPGGKGRK